MTCNLTYGNVGARNFHIKQKHEDEYKEMQKHKIGGAGRITI